MKKLTSTLFALHLMALSHAATITVEVYNNFFLPSNFSAQVGDVVRFVWAEGFHTTTSDQPDMRPPGAAPWDAPIDPGNLTFDYSITVAGNYSYYCRFHPGMTGIFTASAVTPVTLIDFSAMQTSTGTMLHWTTASEQNADHFEVQKSYDGMLFRKIGSVPAIGNSTVQQHYDFLDRDVSGEYRFAYYRLLTIDRDGQSQFSRIILHKNQNLTATSFVKKVYPNPVRQYDDLHLYFESEKSNRVELTFHDHTGRLISATQLTVAEGVTHTHLNLPPILRRGIYAVSFSMQAQKQIVRLVVQ